MKPQAPVVPGGPSALVVTALALPLLLASLGTSIANVALPTLAEAFAVPFSAVQWVATAYLAAMTVATVLVGRLADVLGHRHVLVASLAVFAAASLLAGVAPNLTWLVAARTVQGAGAAALMTLAMTLMREVAGDKGVGRGMGLLGTVSAVGTALGPALGGALLPVAGWHALFLVQVPLAAVALALAVIALPRAVPAAPDAAGRPWSAFDSSLALTLLVNLVIAAVMMSTLVVGPFYLSLGLALSAAHVGLVMAVGPALAIFSGAPAGRLVDAWGAGLARRLGLIMMAAGAALLAFAPQAHGVAGYVLALIVLTPGYQLTQAANNTAAMLDVTRARRGTVSGLLALSRNVGLVTGASGLGALFSLAVGDPDVASASATAIASGMRWTFLAAAGVLAVALGVVGVRRGGPVVRDPG